MRRDAYPTIENLRLYKYQPSSFLSWGRYPCLSLFYRYLYIGLLSCANTVAGGFEPLIAFTIRLSNSAVLRSSSSPPVSRPVMTWSHTVLSALTTCLPSTKPSIWPPTNRSLHLVEASATRPVDRRLFARDGRRLRFGSADALDHHVVVIGHADLAPLLPGQEPGHSARVESVVCA